MSCVNHFGETLSPLLQDGARSPREAKAPQNIFTLMNLAGIILRNVEVAEREEGKRKQPFCFITALVRFGISVRSKPQVGVFSFRFD